MPSSSATRSNEWLWNGPTPTPPDDNDCDHHYDDGDDDGDDDHVDDYNNDDDDFEYFTSNGEYDATNNNGLLMMIMMRETVVIWTIMKIMMMMTITTKHECLWKGHPTMSLWTKYLKPMMIRLMMDMRVMIIMMIMMNDSEKGHPKPQHVITYKVFANKANQAFYILANSDQEIWEGVQKKCPFQ